MNEMQRMTQQDVYQFKEKVFAKRAASAKRPKRGAVPRLPEAPLETAELPKEEALLWIPAGYRLQKDAFNGRWQMSSNLFSVSRSWLKSGEVGAFCMAAKVLWEFESPEGCPHHWIMNVASKHA